MPPLRFPIAVTMQRVPLANRWVSEQWRPAAVEPAPDASVAPEPIGADAGGERWRFRGYAIELHRSEAEGYYLNITCAEPKVFVMWRLSEDGGEPRARPEVVTVSYNEAGRWLDGGEQVDPVPMPAIVLDWIKPFVAEHYKPEPKKKMKRNVLYEGDVPRGGVPGAEPRR